MAKMTGLERAMHPVLDANGCVTGWSLNVVSVFTTTQIAAMQQAEPRMNEPGSSIAVDTAGNQYVVTSRGVYKWE
jgi:oligoribonuclease (3'-5' exoribonuclease)